MSYEKLGMGWSDIAVTTGWWPFETTTFPRCEEIEPEGIKKCFTDDPADVQCANYSGCVELRGETCQTVSGKPGTKYCCPPDRPPPPHVAPCIPEGATPAATAAGELQCRFDHVPFSSLAGAARARSIWTVQNKLCQLGFDTGRVDGTENHPRYHQAIREFQSRRGIPVTGNPDAVTLQAMDLDNAQSLAAAIGGSSLVPDVGVGTTNLLPFMMIGAFGLSGMFLFYAWKKYKRSQR
jgi:hypothetical protein